MIWNKEGENAGTKERKRERLKERNKKFWEELIAYIKGETQTVYNLRWTQVPWYTYELS
jgi:hypothetical protein